MPLTPFPIQEFGGLNLASDPTDVPINSATDLLNIVIKRGGSMFRTRDGLVKFTNAAVAVGATLDRLGYYVGSQHVLVGNQGDNKTYAIDSSGNVLAASPAKAAMPTSYANHGTPASRILYIANGVDTVYTWSGAAFAVPVYTGTTPTGRLLAVTPWDNRLVNAAGALSNTSRLIFSDPGTPTTFQANNFVDLDPGDSESVRALAVWRDLLFAFKDEKFFVFYSTSTDASGNPIFNYRAVRAGLGARDFGSVTVGLEGVYFINDQGIWLTTGSTPVKVSGALDELFRGDVPSTWSGPTPSATVTMATYNSTLAYHDGRLLVAVPFGGAVSSMRVFVLDDGQWTAWSLFGGNANSFSSLLSVPLTFGVSPTLLFTNTVTATDRIYRFDPTATTDDGTPITWVHQTGYSSAGGYFRQRIISSGERKNHFKVDILGAGNVTHQVLTLNKRPADVDDPGGVVTLGAYPAIGRGSRRRGARGTHFAHKLSGSGPATISGLTYWLSGIEGDT